MVRKNAASPGFCIISYTNDSEYFMLIAAKVKEKIF